MIEPVSIGATGWDIIKKIGQIGKKIFDLKVNDEVRKQVQEMIDKSTELYDRIVKLEDERQSNRELISNLEHKIKKAKNFKSEFKKYKPHQFITGSFVYIYDDSIYKDKPMHYICTNCISDEVISILQPSDRSRKFVCHKCKSEFQKAEKDMAINRNSLNHF